MTFPLAHRSLIRGCQAHIAAGLGCAADYVAGVGTTLVAPQAGVVERTYYGSDGGNWLWLRVGDYSLQFAHLSKYLVKQGETVREGQQLALTGNSGSITTGPHLHVQIIKGGARVDPETYFNQSQPPQGGDVTNEQAKLLIYRATQGHEPQGAERAFCLGPISPDELANLRYRDDTVGGYWAASTGNKDCPNSEKDFYQRYAQEHQDQHPIDYLAIPWHNDHAGSDSRLNKAKQIVTSAAVAINEL